eukprot:1475508-Pyramimonas_sp.AAC.1
MDANERRARCCAGACARCGMRTLRIRGPNDAVGRTPLRLSSRVFLLPWQTRSSSSRVLYSRSERTVRPPPVGVADEDH